MDFGQEWCFLFNTHLIKSYLETKETNTENMEP